MIPDSQELFKYFKKYFNIFWRISTCSCDVNGIIKNAFLLSRYRSDRFNFHMWPFLIHVRSWKPALASICGTDAFTEEVFSLSLRSDTVKLLRLLWSQKRHKTLTLSCYTHTQVEKVFLKKAVTHQNTQTLAASLKKQLCFSADALSDRGIGLQGK